MPRALFVGVDVGGTFTDLVMVDEPSHRVYNVKVLTTPERPSAAVMSAVRQRWREPKPLPRTCTGSCTRRRSRRIWSSSEKGLASRS